MTTVASNIVLGLSGLFLSCVQYLEVFLRLHYIGLKLSRWGVSKSLIGTNRHGYVKAAEMELEKLRSCLESIMSRFAEAQNEKQKFRTKDRKEQQRFGHSTPVDAQRRRHATHRARLQKNHQRLRDQVRDKI
ncbi:uncharacterized protein CC84DRAFT_190306 [Paraphaeosphaeria sporulosa]|uniref:Prion-inhibition and propagation HeLo domain-containing protein n=1 Tax=Paraphaeosphaeria sporulosa TaxID=1460663 RepID=A0A177C3X5_9PLEO|nr:uncharacterized protein CC84DRAFT_190306 [Paraphaeosphaeria sporulosa]OAG01370.1 hypothetical protein CC84DRAFT_190306 [Paraphaeosphaeria sporulosa]